MNLRPNQTVTNTNGTKNSVVSTTRDGGARIRCADGQTRWFSAGQLKRYIKP